MFLLNNSGALRRGSELAERFSLDERSDRTGQSGQRIGLADAIAVVAIDALRPAIRSGSSRQGLESIPGLSANGGLRAEAEWS